MSISRAKGLEIYNRRAWSGFMWLNRYNLWAIVNAVMNLPFA